MSKKIKLMLADDHAVVRSGLRMLLDAQPDMEIIAEGVETQEQLRFLKNHRCDLIQGYLISRPIPAAELEQALQAFGKRQRRFGKTGEQVEGSEQNA